jgi:hypothetical protein
VKKRLDSVMDGLMELGWEHLVQSDSKNRFTMHKTHAEIQRWATVVILKKEDKLSFNVGVCCGVEGYDGERHDINQNTPDKSVAGYIDQTGCALTMEGMRRVSRAKPERVKFNGRSIVVPEHAFKGGGYLKDPDIPDDAEQCQICSTIYESSVGMFMTTGEFVCDSCVKSAVDGVS